MTLFHHEIQFYLQRYNNYSLQKILLYFFAIYSMISQKKTAVNNIRSPEFDSLWQCARYEHRHLREMKDECMIAVREI